VRTLKITFVQKNSTVIGESLSENIALPERLAVSQISAFRVEFLSSSAVENIKFNQLTCKFTKAKKFFSITEE